VDLLTDKPAVGVVDVTLSWPAPPDSRLWRYTDRLLMVLWLCRWAWALVSPAGQKKKGTCPSPFSSRESVPCECLSPFGGRHSKLRLGRVHSLRLP
jgi:hypothetical protein